MKDVTSTSFGLIIAFLLPGLSGLIALAYWSSYLQNTFDAFLKAASNVGLFLFVVLLSLIVGLQITAIRWVLFEVIASKVLGIQKLGPGEFGRLGPQNYAAFQGVVDAHYRYHQFWGGLAIVLPVICFGWLHTLVLGGSTGQAVIALSLFFLSETLTIAAAIVAYQNYVKRARNILAQTG